MKNVYSIVNAVISVLLLGSSLVNAQWLEITSIPSMDISALSTVKGMVCAGTFGNIYITANNGIDWTNQNQSSIFPSEGNGNVLSITAIDSTIFASSYIGGIFQSNNNGQTWTASNSGLPIDSYFSVPHLLSVGDILYAGTDDGVYRSVNHGNTWSPLNSGIPPYTHVFSIASKRDSLWWFDGGGTLFFSSDNGIRWSQTSTNLPTIWTLRALNGTLIAGAANGIFRSDDNGKTWFWSSTGLPPNIAIHAFHVIGSIIFSGTDHGAFYSSNNGINWTPLNSGLTAIDIYALTNTATYLFAGTSAGVFRLPLSAVSVVGISKHHTDRFSVNFYASLRPNSIPTLEIFLPIANDVNLDIYNVSGEKVTTLAKSKLCQGKHLLKVAASNLAPGWYSVRATAGHVTITKTFFLMH